MIRRDGVNYLVPFILVTCCFALWGFANGIINPLVNTFSKIFRMSVSESALIQVVSHVAYFVMALPAALYIRRFSYKAAVMLGLALYACGTFIFIPAGEMGVYQPFLVAYFILYCGLSFLETSCGPFILQMGSEQTSTRRINLAQSFNSIGALGGMLMAKVILDGLNPMSKEERMNLDDAAFEAIRKHDLEVLINPYLAIGAFILVMIVCFFVFRFPKRENDESNVEVMPAFKRLLDNRNYVFGTLSQFFYVGVQVMCWTYIIQYGVRIFMSQGIEEQVAEGMAQNYNIMAMVFFCVGRFVCTWLMKFMSAARLLCYLAVAGCALIVGVISLQNVVGLWCLVCVSGCMSLMFPTIYSLALNGVKEEDMKFGGVGMVMAILGGSVFPMFQAMVIDCGEIGGFSAVNASFVLPLICFVVIALYGNKCAIEKRG